MIELEENHELWKQEIPSQDGNLLCSDPFRMLLGHHIDSTRFRASSSIKPGNSCRLLVANWCIGALSASQSLSSDRLNVSLYRSDSTFLHSDCPKLLLQVPVRELLLSRIQLPERVRFGSLFSTESLIAKTTWQADYLEATIMTPYR